MKTTFLKLSNQKFILLFILLLYQLSAFAQNFNFQVRCSQSFNTTYDNNGNAVTTLGCYTTSGTVQTLCYSMDKFSSEPTSCDFIKTPVSQCLGNVWNVLYGMPTVTGNNLTLTAQQSPLNWRNLSSPQDLYAAKGQAIYTSYTFKKDHRYKINLGGLNHSEVPVILLLTNNLTANKTASCGTVATFTGADNNSQLAKPVGYYPTGYYDFIATDNYTQLCLVAVSSVVGTGGTAYKNRLLDMVITESADFVDGNVIQANQNTNEVPFSPQELIQKTGVVINTLPYYTLTYQWQKSTNNGGTWINIVGATNVSYTPPSLSVTTLFRRIALINASVNNTYASNVVAVNVLPFIKNNNIQANQTSSTLPYSPQELKQTTGSALAVYDNRSAVFTYRWQQSLDNGTTWLPINGANQATYTPPAITSTSNSSYMYHRVVSCQGYTSVSNTIDVSIIPTITGNEIQGNQTITAIPFNAQPLIQKNGIELTRSIEAPFLYQWQQSSDGNVWFDIPAATSVSYTPSGLLTKTFFRRKVTVMANITASNPVTIDVAPIANNVLVDNGTTLSSTSMIVYPPKITEVSPVTGVFGTVVYSWLYQINGQGEYKEIPNLNTASLLPFGMSTRSITYVRKVWTTSSGSIVQPPVLSNAVTFYMGDSPCQRGPDSHGGNTVCGTQYFYNIVKGQEVQPAPFLGNYITPNISSREYDCDWWVSFDKGNSWQTIGSARSNARDNRPDQFRFLGNIYQFDPLATHRPLAYVPIMGGINSPDGGNGYVATGGWFYAINQDNTSTGRAPRNWDLLPSRVTNNSDELTTEVWYKRRYSEWYDSWDCGPCTDEWWCNDLLRTRPCGADWHDKTWSNVVKVIITSQDTPSHFDITYTGSPNLTCQPGTYTLGLANSVNPNQYIGDMVSRVVWSVDNTDWTLEPGSGLWGCQVTPFQRFNNTTQNYCNVIATIYAKDGNVITKSYKLTTPPVPAIAVNPTGTVTLCKNMPVNLSVTSVGNVTFQAPNLSLGAVSKSGNVTTVVIPATQWTTTPQVLTITSTDANNCINRTSVNVNPNIDGWKTEKPWIGWISQGSQNLAVPIKGLDPMNTGADKANIVSEGRNNIYYTGNALATSVNKNHTILATYQWDATKGQWNNFEFPKSNPVKDIAGPLAVYEDAATGNRTIYFVKSADNALYYRTSLNGYVDESTVLTNWPAIDTKVNNTAVSGMLCAVNSNYILYKGLDGHLYRVHRTDGAIPVKLVDNVKGYNVVSGNTGTIFYYIGADGKLHKMNYLSGADVTYSNVSADLSSAIAYSPAVNALYVVGSANAEIIRYDLTNSTMKSSSADYSSIRANAPGLAINKATGTLYFSSTWWSPTQSTGDLYQAYYSNETSKLIVRPLAGKVGTRTLYTDYNLFNIGNEVGYDQPGQMYMTYYLAGSCQPSVTRMAESEQTSLENVITATEPLSSSVQVLPNPNNGNFEIKYKLDGTADISLQLYNILGELIQTITDSEVQNAGNYQFSVTREDLPAGMYMIRLLENGNVKTVEKVVVQK